MKQLIHDLRRARGTIWNVRDLCRRYPFGDPHEPWNQGAEVTDESWIDRFVYQGYLRHGCKFLRAAGGRFAIVAYDREAERLFLARDWIGELPMHVLATAEGVFFANSLTDLRREAGTDYAYPYVRAFPHAHVQEIDLRFLDPHCVALTMRPARPERYFDFEDLVEETVDELGISLSLNSNSIRNRLQNAVRQRAALYSEPHAVLLSGGLDSFSVALTFRSLGIPFEAFTLSMGEPSEDVLMAKEFASRLGVTHHLLEVGRDEILGSFEEAVEQSECYHLFNVYCAVGMRLLAKRLAERGFNHAFCGEAVNEALGDYKSWIIKHPRTGERVVLQVVAEKRLERVEERSLFVWGHSIDKGKYNRQLGTGLAKHAGSRMVKPFLASGLTLECPYFDRQLLARLVAIPAEVLSQGGGKSGLVSRVFADDLKSLGINSDLLAKCKKVRLQDGSEDGAGGITQVFLAEGRDQRQAIEHFNEFFGAALDPVLDGRRLAWVEDVD